MVMDKCFQRNDWIKRFPFFVQISNAYKDYLENWAWDKAKGIFKKIRQKYAEGSKKIVDQTAIVPSNAEIKDVTNESNADDNNQLRDQDIYDSESYFEGLENFAFHIAMLLLLAIMSALNFGLSVAWIKSHQ